MAKYEVGDIVTYYFIIVEDDNGKHIQAWSDNKDLVKFYLEFHNCKKFVLKTMTRTVEEISKILEENLHDEIKIHNIHIKDTKSKNGTGYKTISIPATETEFMFINEESNTFMASRINYSFINEAIPYLKGKYRDALKNIFLTDIIKKVIHGQNPKITQMIEFDQLLILFESFPENFGK